MAGLILIGLLALGVIVVVVMVITKQSNKRILQALGGSFVVIAAFMLYTNHTCGPNSTDVKIMTPQANAIAKNIITNGVPNLLSDIQTLPYVLNNCKREKKYEKGYYETVKNRSNADYLSIDETCEFQVEKRIYEINFSFFEHYKSPQNTHGTLRIRNTTTQTGILTSLEINDSGNITVDFQKYPTVYSVKSTGICNPLRQ
ncbi:hypothetical protein [Sulfurimonas sp.]|uniref:hypothetical protein n=1 Tax=Sulfurimonas sp. TaxID=2022749 RepID=UPI003D114639